jgi:hypothetical protein
MKLLHIANSQAKGCALSCRSIQQITDPNSLPDQQLS